MKAQTVVTAFALAIAHFVVTMFSMLCLLGAGLGGGSWWVGWLGVAFIVLGFPGNLIIAQLGGLVGVPNGVIAACVAATSLLWGTAGALLVMRLYRWRLRHVTDESKNTSA